MKKFFTLRPSATFLLGTLALALSLITTTVRAADIVNEPLTDGNLPAGWTQTGVTFTTFARFNNTNSVLTSPLIDLSGYSGVELTFDVAKFGSGGNGPLTVEFSTDGGSTWTAQTFDSPTPTGSTYLTSGPTTITASGANVRFRFTRTSSASEKRLRNVLLTGSLASNTSVAFASSSSAIAENAGPVNLALSITNPDAVNATNVTISASDPNGRLVSYSTSVVFPAGSSSDENVVVSLNDNSICDGDENVVFTITAVTGGTPTAAIGTQNTHTLSVTDNETAVDPVAVSATGILGNGFTANWNAVNGATGYFLDVSTNPTFSAPGGNVVGWNFDDDNDIADSGIPANTGNTISTTADGPISYPGGVGSGDAISSEGWDDGNGTKYWLIDFATTGYGSLSVSSAQRSSNQGPSDFKIQYRIGTGGTWTDVSGGAITVLNNFSSGVLSNLALPAACDNQPQVFLRWIMTSNQRVGSGNVTAGGTSRIDEISIDAGTAPDMLPGYDNLPVAGTSQSVTGLDPLTTYYYRVRSAGGCSTGLNSNVITVVTTAGVAPLLTAGTLTDFGSLCVNTTSAAQSFTVDGTNLTAADVAVGPLSGFSFSTTELGSYMASLSIPQAGGTFSQAVWVKFTPAAVQAFDGNIPVGGGGATSIDVAATGSGINTATVVTTGTASQTGNAQAEAEGSMNTDGCDAVTAYGIEYSTTQGFTPGTGTQEASSNITAGAFSSTLSGLALCTPYYYRAYATTAGGPVYGDEESFTNTDISEPAATTATGVLVDGFTANWDAVAGATGYFLDVSTSPTFGTPLSNTVFTTGFDQGRANLPTGWTHTGLGTDYGSDYGVATPSLKFDGTGDQLVSQLFNGPATSISFWYKGQGTNGSASTLLTEAFDGSSWTTIGTLTNIPNNTTGTETYTLNQNDGYVQFRFTYTKASGNLAFDDASITYLSGNPDYLPGYENLPVTGTSHAIAGLSQNTTYYYRVRANSGCGSSLNSNTISTTTLYQGCTDPLADNYDAGAVPDNGSCTYCAPTITYNAPTPTPITTGTGIPDQNMAVAVDCHDFKVAMNAYLRYVGPIIPTGNVYTTTTGYSPASVGDPTPDPANARWNFLVSVDLGTYDFTEVAVYMDMDFDPGATPVYNTVDISALAVAQGQGASHIQQQAQNLKSAFWSLLFPGVSFDATIPGTYDLRVRIESPTTGTELWSNAIQVVVEAPGCMDPLADNYNAAANVDDGSCTYCAPTISYNVPTPTTITIGSGIPDQNMAVSQDCRGIDVALNAFARYVGPIIPVGNVYTTTTGHSPTSGSDPTPDPVNARWNILGSLDLGSYDFTDVNVFLDLDFDTGVAPVWHTANLSQQMIDLGNGALHVYQASENLASPFWALAFPGITFDPNVPGIYDVRVRLESAYSNEPLVTLAIQVVVDCAPHEGHIWYVNDASTAADIYTTAIGSDGNTGTASCPFGTIAHAVSQASAGDTILVDAGTYVENLVIDKAVDLRGAQYGADPNTRTGAESVIHPATSDPDPYSATGSVIIYLSDNLASGTKINGFTIDGDNPGLTSGVVFNGADMDAIEAIGSYTGNGNLDIAFNVIKNVTYAGLDLDNYNGTGIVTGLRVRNNLFNNITSTSWGIGTVLQYNAYADITDNTMSQVRTGIQTGNHSLPNTGADPVISGNTITSYRLGIFHNVQYTNASTFHITGNDFFTESGSANNTGIFIGYLDPTITVALQNNNVTGAQNGVMMWGANTSVPVTVEGGTLTDCGTGVFVNNYDAYPSSPDINVSSNAVVKDVAIVNAGTGIHVKDNMLNTHPTATVHVGIEGTTSVNVANGGINVLVTGAKASGAFSGNGVDLTGSPLRYIRLESNGATVPTADMDATQVQFNGATATTATGFTIEDLIDHKPDLLTLGKVSFVPGELFVTLNSFVSPNTVGSVQRGIDAAAVNDIVHVNDGTYNEDVNVNKVVTVQGNDRDLTILRGVYGTTAAALGIGANAIVKDLTSTRDFGADLAAWQASPKTQGVQFNGNNASMDNVLVTGHRNGVYINNRQDISVTNCIIENNRTGLQMGNTVTGTVITNNFIRDNFTMGVLFNFDLSGTPNTTGLVVSENSITGNWYGDVSYQSTPSSTVSGADFSCNWYGTPDPVVSATATGEPGYGSQTPSQFGGTAPAPPAGQIMGVSAALVPYQPFGHAGTDDAVGTPGFQPIPGNCDVIYYSQSTGDVSDPIWDIIPVGTAGPATFTASTSMVVQNGHTVTNTTDADVKDLTVQTGGTLALNTATTLTVNGDEAIFDGTLTAANTSTLKLAGTDATILESSGGPLSLWNLTVNTPQGTLTDATISIRGTLQLDGGDFDASLATVTLASGAMGTGRLGPVVSGASYTGDITMQRYIPAGHTNWRMLGSPVAGKTVNDWKDDFFTAGFPGSHYPNFYSPVGSGILWPSVRWYNESLDSDQANDGVMGVSSNTQPLNPGQGFMAWSGDNLTTTQAFTVDVTGPPNIAASPITLPMSFTASGTVVADGWNLVSNPLPSPISFSALQRGTDVENAYWIFDPVAGNNKSWVNGVGQGGLNGVIQSSQGFWVKADGTNLTTTVDEAAKVSQSGGGTFGGDQNAVLPILNLSIASGLNTYSDEATVVFAQGSPAYDGIDALKMTFKTIGAPQIGLLSSDGHQLAVDFFGSYSSAVQIPLKVDVDVTGTYTISAAMAGITSLSCMSLTDLQTGAVTPLTDGATYSFTINAEDDADVLRFVINGSSPLPFYNEAALCNGQEGRATVVVNEGPVDITWTDVFGNVLLHQTNVADGIAEFDGLAGDYQVHITPGGACGELATDFTITAPEAINADVLQTATSCPNSDDGSVEIGAVTGGTAPYSFLWSNGTATNSITGAAGNYTGTITDAAGCTSTVDATIPAGEGAIAQFSTSGGTLLANTPVLFTNSSVLADSYLWDFGDGSTSTEFAPEHSYALPGIYTVTLTATGGDCTGSTTMELTVESTTAIGNTGGNLQLAVWATPDQIIIQHGFGNAPVDVDVYDATGRLAISRGSIVMPERITLNDRNLNTGLWLVRVKSGKTERTFRVPLVR